MKYPAIAAFTAAGLAAAGPLPRILQAREVPQEHSHNVFLDLVRTSLDVNNPKNIQDPVFGLLGNAAAAAGAGTVTNLDCLQQETADQAFTNAKAAGDIPGMAGALMYRAIERNTAKVGLASVICNETAVNPEIDALSQHQDPASSNAASTNKGIVLELAKQLAAIGADPLLALESGTFAPGNLDDDTGKGNSCDTEDDEPGCILSQRLLVLDASEAEISSAVAGITPTITGTGVIKATDIDFAGLSIAGGGSVEATAAADDATAAAAVQTAAASVALCPASPTTATAAAASSTCSVITTTVAADVASRMRAKRAAEFGTCGSPAILFEAGLDGRGATEAFTPEDQESYNHGSALNIGVIAGFICQRLGSPCSAAADVQASCTSASAAAVATTQNQAAADVFNSILGVTAGAAVATASATLSSVVMTITQCA